MCPNSENTPSGTDSVPDVKYLFPNVGPNAVSSLSAKCTTCKVPTEKQWIKVTPIPMGNPNPMEVLKLTKRLIMCTQCGTFQLTN